MSRRVAIVTGGGRGIGLAIARALAGRGFDLCIADLAGTDLEVVDGARAIFVPTDIADLASHAILVERTVAELGRIDCLVNNAGIGAVVRADPLDLDPDNFDRVMAVNLRGTVFLTQAVVRRMLAQTAQGPRSIVTITSVSADLASPERLDYCMSKAGLAMWSKGLALRLAKDGIGVFDVRPGIIRTDMTAAVAGRYEAAISGGLVPAGRWGEPGDVAEVVAALASGAFGFATGSVLDVGGGLAIPRL